MTDGSSWCFPWTRVSKGSAPGGAESVLRDTVEIGLSTKLHPTPSPTHLDCVLHWASGQRSLLFQATELFSLPFPFLPHSLAERATHGGSTLCGPTKTHIQILMRDKTVVQQKKGVPWLICLQHVHMLIC